MKRWETPITGSCYSVGLRNGSDQNSLSWKGPDISSGAIVFVGDQEIPTDETGAFEHRISLELGINLIIVEAVDRAGNVSYQSGMLARKF